MPFSEATLNAWLTPAPPGVTEVTFAIELPPADPHQRVEADRDVVGGEEDRHHAEAGDPAEQRRSEDADEVLPRLAQDAAALLGVVPPVDDLRPERADQQVDQEGAAEQEDRGRPRPLVHEGELDVERAADREEEVQVRERADQREEDLLDDVGAEHAGEGRAGDDRGEHQQHHEGADVGRQEAVQRHRGRVAGEDDLEARRRVGVAQDRVPGVGGQRRLDGLERDARDHVGRRDLGDRVPEVREPAADVPAEQVGGCADHDDQDRPDQ